MVLACPQIYLLCIATGPLLAQSGSWKHSRRVLMETPLIEFCEQANPRVLSEARCGKFHNANRVHRSLLAGAGNLAIGWMAGRTPASLNSDHLILLGFLGQV